jgi:hypothetical protein
LQEKSRHCRLFSFQALRATDVRTLARAERARAMLNRQLADNRRFSCGGSKHAGAP